MRKEVFSKNRLIHKLNTIKELNIPINKYIISKQDTNFIMQIDFGKIRSSVLQALLNYQPSNNNLNGYFSLANYNLFNSLRVLDLYYEKYNQINNFKLQFIDPCILHIIFKAGLNFLTYDTVYAKTNFDCNIGLPVNDYFDIACVIGYEHLISTLQYHSSYSTGWFGQGIKFNYLSSLDMVPKTMQFELVSQVGSRSIARMHHILNRTSLNSKMQIPIHRQLGLSLDISSKYIYCKTGILAADSLYLGGIKNLRGYQENEIATVFYLAFRNEIKYYFTSSYVVWFDDFAIYKKTAKLDLKNGFGFGIRTKSRIGTVGIDYGLSQLRNPLQGKIHLIFQSQF